MNLHEKIKPSVSKRNLLLIAGLAWTVAGFMLSGRGLVWLLGDGHRSGLRIAGGLLGGGIFYLLLFSKISTRHILRIRTLSIPFPCAFSFFNLRGYFLMALMITTGILLRRFDLISRAWLNTFYVTMGLPLLISAARFFYFWATNRELT